MGRPIRIHLPNLNHHILNRGNNRQDVFLEDSDYLHYLDILKRYKHKFNFKIFAYCLMKNHIHLLIKTSSIGTVSDIMKAITIAHTRRYHYKYKSSGHVWQGRFKSPLVSADEYFFALMRYIEQNPVRAGLVDHPAKYRYSSYHANVIMERDELIDKEDNPSFLSLGRTMAERIQNYKRIVLIPLEESKAALIRKSLGGQSHFSSDSYLERVQKDVLRTQKKPPGRPSLGNN